MTEQHSETESVGKPKFTDEELREAQWLGVEGDTDGPQIAVLEGGFVVMRHGGDPDAPYLVYTPAEWDAFQRGAADGEFDNLPAPS
ncbi:DUF397 domain-containing protein [Kitasatospora sp. NPDC056138]|uniref:DUF397 domain-containing protein n=1 Tax=Kitasatospora sp. NPDC056138 TaxID=3345724 RepID=UPI0035D7ABBB